MAKDYTQDALYKSAIENAEKSGLRRPETIRINYEVPFDCYELFLKRFYDEYSDFQFTHTRKRVMRSNLIGNLLWLFGTRSKGSFSENIFDLIDEGLVRKVKKRQPDPTRKGIGGRKPTKHLIDLFEGHQAPPEDIGDLEGDSEH